MREIENRGGARIGAGRKKADYETKSVSARVRTDELAKVEKLLARHGMTVGQYLKVALRPDIVKAVMEM